MSVSGASLGLFGGQATGATQNSTEGTTGTGTMTTSDFLNLLVTELQNQDPLDASDSSSFMQQMSTLEDVSAIGQMTAGVASLASLSESQSALALIGQTVTLQSGENAITGQVTGVQAGASGPELLVGGALYALSAVTSVGSATAPAGASAAGTSGGGETP
jgi:flagellar basal-body rod modification protein FlgD